jgi:signal transduction histidine kinase
MRFVEASASCRVFSGDVGDQSVTAKPISIRAAKRERIAQDLHDSSFQLLAAIQLNLDRLRRQGIDELEATIEECEEIIAQIGQCMREICNADPA